MTTDHLKYCRLTILAVLISLSCAGQTTDKGDNVSRKISRHDFDSQVDKSIRILKSRDLNKITDKEHIDIMYCLNTIFVLGTKDKAFKEGRYKDLETVAEQKDYIREIIKVYPDWTPNRGMGYYFVKLKMELYGTPSEKSVYQIQD